jgi:hypothetical protein
MKRKPGRQARSGRGKPENRDFFLFVRLSEMPYNVPIGSDIASVRAMPCVFTFCAFCARFRGFFKGHKYMIFSA